MTERSVTHATFTIERTYDAAPEKVFAACADPAAKRRWFVEGEGWHIDRFEMDFRPGGIDTSVFRFGDGPPGSNDTVYLDICRKPPHRQRLYHDNRRQRLTYTEQGAFLDGHDNAAQRESGCRELLEALAKQLQRNAAA
jgi:catechol 2,3-dioxygenase-like lactoylglutathione lyase family enzyme